MKHTNKKNKPSIIEAKLKPGINLELDSEYEEEDGQDEEFDEKLFAELFKKEIEKYEFE